mmetsp:Transcript_8218/g.20451  ORF Transcript_8218/g.20451 Transcript_8218/m.20451 type:complete len:238 (+) Transcript_8218:1848-2561(+)
MRRGIWRRCCCWRKLGLLLLRLDQLTLQIGNLVSRKGRFFLEPPQGFVLFLHLDLILLHLSLCHLELGLLFLANLLQLFFAFRRLLLLLLQRVHKVGFQGGGPCRQPGIGLTQFLDHLRAALARSVRRIGIVVNGNVHRVLRRQTENFGKASRLRGLETVVQIVAVAAVVENIGHAAHGRIGSRSVRRTTIVVTVVVVATAAAIRRAAHAGNHIQCAFQPTARLTTAAAHRVVAHDE